MAQVFNFVAVLFLSLDLLQCYNLKLQRPNISPKCELEGICDSVENYPTQLVRGLIERLDLLQCYNLKLQRPNISPKCELEGICDSVENYPTQLVRGLIERLKSQNTIFDYDEAPMPKIYSRFYDIDEEPLSLCKTTPRFVPVHAAKDMDGNWQYIINDSKEPVQVFRTEICRTRMGRCTENIGFGPGYDGACIQKMVFREMFYVAGPNETDRSYFEVPTCCSCSLFRRDSDK